VRSRIRGARRQQWITPSNKGNPADAPRLAPAIARITRRTGQPPRAVTADRGYGEARVDSALHDLGVRTVAIPRKGSPGPARRASEHRRPFRDLVKWRTGCEGRIAHLKRRSSWNRTMLGGPTGARIWCGHGVFTRNLTKVLDSAGFSQRRGSDHSPSIMTNVIRPLAAERPHER